MKIILPDGSVQEAEDELRAIRHTASHVLAQAVISTARADLPLRIWRSWKGR